MFGHNFKYTFKVLMRNRMLLFWTFVFPLVLGTMFKLAFSNIENSEKLNVIPIAIVDNEEKKTKKKKKKKKKKHNKQKKMSTACCT